MREYFVNRKNGAIIGLFGSRQYPGQESLPETSQDIMAWFETEAAQRAAIGQKKTEKSLVIEANLRDWVTVESTVDSISDLAGSKAFLKKLARVVYWLAKNKAE